MKQLLAELVDVLGHDNDLLRTRMRVDSDSELQEREFLRNDIIHRLESGHLEAPCRELQLLSDWVWAAEHQRLSALNKQHSALLDLCPDAAAIVDLDGRIQYVNRAATLLIHAMTGLVDEHIIGKTARELGIVIEAGPSPADLPALARSNSVAEALLAGHWHEIRATAVRGKDGRANALGLTFTDIHERKIGLVRLELLSKLSRLVGTVDRDQLWTALSYVAIPQLADWCVVSVVDEREIKSTFISHRDPSKASLREKLVNLAIGPRHHPLWQNLLSSGFQLLADVTDDMVRKLLESAHADLVSQVGIRSLMVVPVVSRGKLIAIITLAYTNESGRRYGRDDPGVALELALHAAHIAENARLVAETKASDARFRIALAEARTIVYEQDASLRYVFDYGHELSASMLGKRAADALPPDEAAALDKIKQHVLDTGEPVHTEIELSFGGEKRWYRETIEAVRDRRGRRVGVIGAATDLTEEKAAQAALQQALAIRDRVMGILSHDLRNPLSTMTMAASMLLHTDDASGTVKNTAMMIERAANRMTEMIETLLDFTRVRVTGKPLSIILSHCNLAEIVNEIVDEARNAAPGRTIALDVRGCTTGVCDASRIGQALSNLTANALTYGDATQPISIELIGTDRELLLRVHNEGRAIPEALQRVMFEPFARGEEDVVSPHGLGLGLFVVREIVASHNGSIAVESTPEAGTTFTIRLPTIPPDAEAAGTIVDTHTEPPAVH
ncbi:MAG TPA: PAS domain-containing protein [Kofleriaceae bacterium]|nr:PAS domain-containing protein [Kofleriaceae bacterium]